jgi:ribosome-associated heat shock protein Hsp15
MTSRSDKTGLREAEAQRLDKWLWFSRVLKSRTLAAQLVTDGRVRVNRARVTKPSHAVRAGDVLTITLRGRVLVLRIQAPGHRRGPPAEARQLYEIVADRNGVADKQAGSERPTEPVAQRDPGTGRPSKRDRRLMERLTKPE